LKSEQGDLFKHFFGKKKLKKRPLVLSYSQINTYQQCPLKYKFQYIERRPTKPSPHLALGNTIHDTLRDFHKEFDPKRTSLEDLLSCYEKNWVAEGYESKEQEEEFRREGERMLRDYYQTAIRNSNLPLHLEENFKFRMGDCEIWGKIDRIDRLPNGEWEIIDYKTGKRRIEEARLKADLNPLEVDENFQLSLYYLGCKEKFNRTPEKVSIYYLKNNQKLSATRSPEQLRDVERIVDQVAAQIREKKFEAKKGPLCPWCDYREICPALKEAPR
jgi:RecB family exonuclease